MKYFAVPLIFIHLISPELAFMLSNSMPCKVHGNSLLRVLKTMLLHQLQDSIYRVLYLDANHFLWDIHHGIGQPALQALGKVTDGLS